MADHEEPGSGTVSDGADASRGIGRRIWLAGAAVAAVALIAAASAYAFTGRSTSARTSQGHTPQAQQSRRAPCGLRIVESAVTRKNHYFNRMRDPLNDLFIASAIIENPCKLAATNAPFVVTPLDSQGHELGSAVRPVQSHFSIDLIMPGQRAAGLATFTRQQAPNGVASLKVQPETRFLGPICWIDPAASGFQTVARGTDIAVGKRDTSRTVLDGQADVSFAVTWSPRSLALGRRGALVIFRDSSGRLLNVGSEIIGSDAKPGQREHFVGWIPPHADPARTEVILEPLPDSHGLPYKPSAPCLASP